jgi:hypothetical protein
VLFVDQHSESKLRDPKLLDFIKKIDAYIDSDIESMGAAYRHASESYGYHNFTERRCIVEQNFR